LPARLGQFVPTALAPQEMGPLKCSQNFGICSVCTKDHNLLLDDVEGRKGPVKPTDKEGRTLQLQIASFI